MPNTKSATKALRVSIRNKEINLKRKSKIILARRALNKILTEESPNQAEINTALAIYFSALDKGAKVHFINKGKASRLKSRMHTKIKKVLGINTETNTQKQID